MALTDFQPIETPAASLPRVNPVTKAASMLPHVTTGPVCRDSEGYSLQKVLAFASGQCSADQCKEELHVHEQLKGLLKTKGFYPSKSSAMLVPIGTNQLPKNHEDGSEWSEMRKLSGEIREKQMASLPNAVDFDMHSYVEKKFREKTILTTNNTTLGGSYVAPPQLGEVIELQRNFEAFSRAGARQITLPPNGRIQFPKQTGAGSAYWVGENAALTVSNVTTGQLSLEAKKLGALYDVSDEMLRFASPDMEAMLRTDLAAILGLEADARMFDGVGGTQIKGLLTYPTQTSWTSGTDKVLLYTQASGQGLGTDGNTFQPQDFVKMTHLLPDPVQQLSKTWLLRTDFSQNIMAKRADAITAADQAGPFVFSITRDPMTGMARSVYGSDLVMSSNVPGNRVKGSGTNLTCAILGAFSDWIIARSGVLEIMVNPWETTAFTNVYNKIRAIQYIDAGPRHEASFAYSDTLLRTA